MNSQSTNNLPSGWTITNLGSIISKISNGITHKQTKTNHGIPVTRIETISNGIIDLDRVGYLSEVSDDLIEKYKLESGDILFSNINSDFHLGKTAIFTFDILLLHGMNLLLLRPNKEIIIPKFLNYLCNWLRFSGIFISLAQHAVNQSSINQTKVSILKIPLAPLKEQKRIVSKLEELFTKLDAGIEYLKKTQTLLKQYRQSVLKHAFEGKLTEKWREENKREFCPSEKLFDKLKNKSEYSKRTDVIEAKRLSNGWISTKLGYICELNSGQHILENNYNRQGKGIPYITGPADFTRLYPTISKWTEKPKAIARKDDVLITVKGAGVGKVNILNMDNVSISRQLMAIRANLNPLFIFYYLYYNFYNLQKLGLGSTVPGIDRKSILNIDFLLPSSEEQKKIVLEIENKFSIIENNNHILTSCIRYSNKLRQSVLKIAFEGKLVPQDPNDEPASVLLEKIKNEREFNIPFKKEKSKMTQNKSTHDSKQMRLM